MCLFTFDKLDLRRSVIFAMSNCDSCLSHFFIFINRRLRVDDSVLWPQQKNGLLHHPDVHPLYPDRGPLLGLLLDQERRYACKDGLRYCTQLADKHLSCTSMSNLCHLRFNWSKEKPFKTFPVAAHLSHARLIWQTWKSVPGFQTFWHQLI